MNEELIKKIQETSDLQEIKELIKDLHPYDISVILSAVDDEKKEQILSLFNAEELAEILSYNDADDAGDILEDLDPNQVANIINEMETDDAADILEELDDGVADKIKNLLDEDTREDIETVSKYDENTAGAIMNTNFVKIKEKTSLKDAMKVLVQEAPDAETINVLFIVDDQDELLGVIDLKNLITARMPKTVNDIMLENFASVSVTDDLDTVVKVVKDYDTIALPVLNGKVIEGIITMDDAMETLTSQAEEDYAKLAGLTTDEEKDETIFSSFKKRIPWLIILLVLDILIAIVISRFNDVISKLTILTFFQAAVLGLSGNTGTQALAVTIRKLADDDTDNKTLFKHVLKELVEGLGTALILGMVSFALVIGMLFIQTKIGMESYDSTFILNIGLVLGVSVLISVFLSNFIGTILPIFFYKIHVDPAVASGPFITTLNDIIAVLVYFGSAMILMSAYLA